MFPYCTENGPEAQKRPLQYDDIADLKEWLGDSSLYQYWGIVHKKDNKVIGEMWVYLIENNRMVKVAFWLSTIYQGNGLMAEALAEAVTFCFEQIE